MLSPPDPFRASGPPGQTCYDLDEALTLLVDLEDAWRTYVEHDLLAGVITIGRRSSCCTVSLGSEETMIEDPIMAKAKALGAISKSEAAERLGVSTRDIVEAVYYQRIRFVMVDGIAFIPEDALSEYPQAS